jgi:thymidylate synthase
MKQYLDLIQDILDHGVVRGDRTGVGTHSVFGRQLRFDLRAGFPAVTTKKLAWKSVVSELLWFLEGSTNEHRLAEIKNDNKPYDQLTEQERHTIWTANYEKQGVDLGYEDGELGPIYGHQWRHWDDTYIGFSREVDENGEAIPTKEPDHIDQLKNAIIDISFNPTSRRIMVNAWNVAKIKSMALPPCHYGFQFYVSGEHLSLMWNQRSVDVMLGLPFNIASYALLLSIVAKLTNKIPHELIGNLGDCHIYKNHIEGALEQVSRTPHELPTLLLPEIDYTSHRQGAIILKELFGFPGTIGLDEFLKMVKTSDFILENYHPDPTIKMEMAV